MEASCRDQSDSDLVERRLKKCQQLFDINSKEDLFADFSCAYTGDVLLYGRLYIFKNSFAFHSKFLGHVTKFTIPLEAVKEISKERTAKIIPNAIGVSTNSNKFIFGSLLSRRNAFQVMNRVFTLYKEQTTPASVQDEELPVLSNHGLKFRYVRDNWREEKPERAISRDEFTQEDSTLSSLTQKTLEFSSTKASRHVPSRRSEIHILLIACSTLLIASVVFSVITLWRFYYLPGTTLERNMDLGTANAEVYLLPEALTARLRVLDDEVHKIAAIRKTLEKLADDYRKSEATPDFGSCQDLTSEKRLSNK
ncbi:unnamed protein product [Notodromas monacha]|uniref:GRAM domain-containing protein n=1 Tax=Notodromas monacha TaxID=399045 RepID=A0A7R9G938_9CRUS|nr:unnamed protein product [Notodromas monacha]CAG0913910.1 unnamed protein product [Notodromas monacha]